jgi:hypothetical protein
MCAFGPYLAENMPPVFYEKDSAYNIEEKYYCLLGGSFDIMT